ncbi:hypothetical protein CROQUDRAFT_658505 [Cronartium quercuum f. sp. fusiforme G11]|uniref:Uncharacterized protein n=1 Tax=Cronartium quercuum f. sp. fusiforme G11 TaxID=708437 RepID=A0A9P6NL55_9BASI|nr:hypothetical protein CROQUDRAFT_658505 [Cronartium quercuum f. sp. fusiforme G11]
MKSDAEILSKFLNVKHGQSRLPDLQALESITIGFEPEQCSKSIMAAARFVYGDPGMTEREVRLLEYKPAGQMMFMFIQQLAKVYSGRQRIHFLVTSEVVEEMIKERRKKIAHRQQEEKVGLRKPPIFDTEDDLCQDMEKLFYSEMNKD